MNGRLRDPLPPADPLLMGTEYRSGPPDERLSPEGFVLLVGLTVGFIVGLVLGVLLS